jgi:hypothetical protein
MASKYGLFASSLIGWRRTIPTPGGDAGSVRTEERSQTIVYRHLESVRVATVGV